MGSRRAGPAARRPPCTYLGARALALTGNSTATNAFVGLAGLAGFAALDRIYAGTAFTCGEAVYDGTADATVRLTSTGC